MLDDYPDLEHDDLLAALESGGLTAGGGRLVPHDGGSSTGEQIVLVTSAANLLGPWSHPWRPFRSVGYSPLVDHGLTRRRAVDLCRVAAALCSSH